MILKYSLFYTTKKPLSLSERGMMVVLKRASGAC